MLRANDTQPARFAVCVVRVPRARCVQRLSSRDRKNKSRVSIGGNITTAYTRNSGFCLFNGPISDDRLPISVRISQHELHYPSLVALIV